MNTLIICIIVDVKIEQNHKFVQYLLIKLNVQVTIIDPASVVRIS